MSYRHWKKKKSCLEKTKTPRRDERPGDLMSSWTLQQCLIFQHTCTQVTVFYCSSRKWHIRQEWTAKFFKSSSFLLTWESFRVLAEKLQNFVLHKTKKLNWQPVGGGGGGFTLWSLVIALPAATRSAGYTVLENGWMDITSWKVCRLDPIVTERKQNWHRQETV